MIRKHNCQSVSELRVKSAAASPIAASLASNRTLRVLVTCLAFFLLSQPPVFADHVHHLWYNNSQWQDQDLTALTNGGIATSYGAITAFYTTPNKQLHVYYVDNQAQHVHQLYYNGTSWNEADLTGLTGGPTASAYGISGFALGNLQYVFYVGTDNHVHELYYNNANWTDNDITALAGANLASFGAMLAFVTTPNNQLHVYYQDQNLDLHQLYFNGTSWSDADLTSITGAYCYTQWITGFAVGNLQHVYCPGFGKQSNNLDMLHIYYNNSTWVYEDITYQAGGSRAPINLGSGVAAFKFPGYPQWEVYGVTDDTHFVEYTRTSPNWFEIDLTADFGAPIDSQFGGIVAFLTRPNDQIHLYYAPSTEVYQLYWNGTTWVVEDLTSGSGQADDNSGMAGFAIGSLQHVFYMSYGN